MLKNKKLTKKELCDKWLINKTINPETSRKIKENGEVYKKLSKLCSLNQKLTKKELCDKWLINKTINPETSRKIKENGEVYKKLSKLCSVKSSSSFKTVVSEKSDNRKIKAFKKIHNLFIPYIKRISANIIDRINYFNIMKKYLLSIKETKNCLRLYNIDSKTNKPIYRVGTKIILDKQIGSESVYGIVFLAHFKSNIKYGTKFDKLNKFAVKITNQTNSNKKEILILENLTQEVKNFKCPHFPISYGSLRCNNSRAKSNNSDDYSIVKDKHKKKKLFPKLVNNNKSLLIQLNELASGDLKYNLTSRENTDIFNTITQILISIMFFQDRMQSYHTDTHAGNFLYHKIKPGGYFHYNIYGKDYYLENKGYLWVIWDFGLVKSFSKTDISINYDHKLIIESIDYFIYNYKLLSSNEYKIIELLLALIKKYDNIKTINLSEKINNEILDFLIKKVSSFKTIKPSNIINENPYIIEKKPEIKESYFKKIINYMKIRRFN
jgi:DNA-binding transcriptional regulator YhcF (GntR family)